MLVYRFRLTTEEQEDFIREIEIQPCQTFLDFHEIIVSSSDLESCQNASFFTTDKKYKKHQEISFKQQKKQLRKYDEELDEVVTETKVPRLMKDSKLKDFIEDPHQKMIYEFYGKDLHAFNLELFKIIKTEETYLLPRCKRSIGELLKHVEIPLAPVVAPPEEEAAIHTFIKPTLLDESLFSGIQEDDSELAEIDSHLEEILAMGSAEIKPEVPKINDIDEEDLQEPEVEERMESLDDYEDLENLEIKHRDFDRESDDN